MIRRDSGYVFVDSLRRSCDTEDEHTGFDFEGQYTNGLPESNEETIQMKTLPLTDRSDEEIDQHKHEKSFTNKSKIDFYEVGNEAPEDRLYNSDCEINQEKNATFSDGSPRTVKRLQRVKTGVDDRRKSDGVISLTKRMTLVGGRRRSADARTQTETEKFMELHDDETEHTDLNRSERNREYHENVILDNYKTLEEVSQAISQQGLEKCSLIFGIDYTISNMRQGQKTFKGRNLHHLSSRYLNPYQRVICILGETLEPLDKDRIIPVYGFGDFICSDRSVFELRPGGSCEGFVDVLNAYRTVTPTIKLGGPTNFAPIIYKAIEIVKEKNEYHILVIVADGQVAFEKPSQTALVEASHFPLSIIVVGVGDGPWESMKTFDDGLADRLFDNFQFVDFHEVMKDSKNPEAAFALKALMEIPEQYKYLKKNGLVN